MNKNRKRAKLVGSFILIAYGVVVNGLTDSKIIVMFADAISGFAVIGIAVLLFPLVKIVSNKLSFGYLTLKIIEGSIMVAGGIIFLSESLHPVRVLMYDTIHLYSFILSGFIFYFILYKSNIVPRFISIWGAGAIFSLLITTVLRLLGISYLVLDILLVLIISNELFLAIWLMIKGFDLSTIESIKKKDKVLVKKYI